MRKHHIPGVSKRPDPKHLRAAYAGSALLLLFAAQLLAQTQSASIRGVVRNSAGVALAKAKVTLEDASGGAILSVFTDSQGAYRISLVNARVFAIRVDCSGYQSVTRNIVNTSARGGLKLDFALRRAPQSPEASPNALGTVSFYEGRELEPGQLKDPSAGGGYSDSATAQGNEMIKQYLIPRRVSPAPPRSSHEEIAGAKDSEKSFESSGAALLAQRDFARATPLFRRAVRYYPQSARLQMGLGVSLYGQGEYPAAVEALWAAARLAPDDASADLLLSEAVQLATPRPNEEITMLLKGFAKEHPRLAIAHYAYALDLWRRFRFDYDGTSLTQARLELEKAVTLDPALVAAHLQLGIVYDEEKLTSRAIQQYRETIRLNPNLATAHYRLARDDQRTGAKKKAAEEIETYEKLRKDRYKRDE